MIWKLPRSINMQMLFKLANNRTFTNNRSSSKGVPACLLMRPLPVLPRLVITGITRSNTGAVLGACTVELYRRNQDQTRGVFVDSTTSDASGNFSFVVGLGQQYQHLAYKVGAPDVAGISVRTLIGI